MSSPTTPLMIAITTVDSIEQADRLAKSLLAQRLAACVQVDGPITSCYRWRNQVERDTEWRLIIKSPPERIEAVRQCVHQCHPYDLPQWVVIAAEASAGYARWAADATAAEQGQTGDPAAQSPTS